MIETSNRTPGGSNRVVIPVIKSDADQVHTILTGDLIKILEDKEYKLTISTDDIEYDVPSADINISKVATKLGLAEDNLMGLEVSVEIEKQSESKKNKIVVDAESDGYTVVYDPVRFSVKAKATDRNGKDRTVEIDQFSNFVERRVALPNDTDITTAITGMIYMEDGTFNHVPTKVVEENGVNYACISSMTNSDYILISNPVEVETVTGHWSENAVNGLASRLIIEDTDHFNADALITRADFITYLVKGLGLYRSGSAHDMVFTDMTIDNADALTVAKSYGIVSGYLDGSVHPDTEITREEAIVLLENAVNAVGIFENRVDSYPLFTDESEVSEWAKPAIKHMTGLNIINGISKGILNPKGKLTYGQAATVIEKLLQKASLID